MASQPVRGREDVTSLEVQSYVTGYHVYKDIWNPRISKVLPLQREPNNSEEGLPLLSNKLTVLLAMSHSILRH